jgi:hypothetical protein
VSAKRPRRPTGAGSERRGPRRRSESTGPGPRGEESQRGDTSAGGSSAAPDQPVCALCGYPIEGRYLADYWGNAYHEGHTRTNPACRYCGRLIANRTTGGGTTYEDGRIICALCRKRAIDTRRRGLEVLYEARSRLEKHGIVIRPFDPAFKLLYSDTLKKYSSGGDEQGLTHVTKRTGPDGSIKELSIRVFVLSGLPYEDFLAAAAHELMHVWLRLNGRDDAKRWFVEGSCNMAAFLVLREERSREAEYRIRQMRGDRDKVYGRGFRKVLRFYQKRGKKEWLRAARYRSSLPLL